MDTEKAKELLAADPCRVWGCDIPSPCCDHTKPYLHVLILMAEALKGRCWHQELYEERADGASDIYPDIMHRGKCGDETECEPCSVCTANAEWQALDTPPA
jgi:hypothetical protein